MAVETSVVEPVVSVAPGTEVDLAAGAEVDLVAGAEVALAAGTEVDLAAGAEVDLAPGAEVGLAAGSTVALVAGTGVYTTDQYGNTKHVDKSGHDVALSLGHHKTHDGRLFNYVKAETINVAVKRYLVKIPADLQCHMSIVFWASGQATFNIKSDPNLISEGTEITTNYNTNDFSVITKQTVISENPSFSGGIYGTLRWSFNVGTSGGAVKTGGMARTDEEQVWGCTLAQGNYKYYTLEIDSKASGNEVGFLASFYENANPLVPPVIP